jgi:hypothetical protein
MYMPQGPSAPQACGLQLKQLGNALFLIVTPKDIRFLIVRGVSD